MKKCCNRLRLRAGVGVDENLPTPTLTPTPVKTTDSGRLRLRLRSPGGYERARSEFLLIYTKNLSMSGRPARRPAVVTLLRGLYL